MSRGANDTPSKDCCFCGYSFEKPYDLSNANWAAKRFCSRPCAQSFRRRGNRPLGEGRVTPEQVGSEELLRRLIRYGLANDSDLGMGYQAFMGRARELGLAA